MILSGLRCVIGDIDLCAEALASQRLTLADCLKIVERATARRVASDRYIGTGRLRYFDPIALCIGELFGSVVSTDVLQATDSQLICTARGAGVHYFEVTRVLLGAQGRFSPLAYANRSLNAIPAQIAQLLGLHGGAFALKCQPGEPLALLRHAWRRLQVAHGPKRVLLCGGQFPSLHPLSRRVYADQAESPDICFTLIAGLPTGECEPSWMIDWCAAGGETGQDGLLLRVDPQRNAELLHGGILVGQARLNNDATVLLLQALLAASVFPTEPLVIQDLSGLTCCLRRLR